MNREQIMEPLVSIIIPVYNRQDTIMESINSVLKQSYKNMEILVIDDGSTDNTEYVVKQIKDNRIKLSFINQFAMYLFCIFIRIVICIS